MSHDEFDKSFFLFRILPPQNLDQYSFICMIGSLNSVYVLNFNLFGTVDSEKIGCVRHTDRQT